MFRCTEAGNHGTNALHAELLMERSSLNKFWVRCIGITIKKVEMQDCPKDWACIDDSPDPIDPNNVHGICVGNKRIPGCEIVTVCPEKKPRLNVSIEL